MLQVDNNYSVKQPITEVSSRTPQRRKYFPIPADTVDIKARGKFPANVLSNFSATNFVYDGVQINSIEGFLQSLKVQDPEVQKKVCAMSGFDAKKFSKSIQNKDADMLLFWKGEVFRKDSDKFHDLVKKVVELQKKTPSGQIMTFDGVPVKSVNAFVTALRVNNPELQKLFCSMGNDELKALSKTITPIYDVKVLYWNGKEIKRDSNEYAKLLQGVYEKRFDSDLKFRNALRAIKNKKIIHSIGKSDIHETILTEGEFLANLRGLLLRDSNKLRLNDFFKNILSQIHK